LGKLPASQKIFSENAAQMNAVTVELEHLHLPLTRTAAG